MTACYLSSLLIRPSVGCVIHDSDDEAWNKTIQCHFPSSYTIILILITNRIPQLSKIDTILPAML